MKKLLLTTCLLGGTALLTSKMRSKNNDTLKKTDTERFEPKHIPQENN